MGEVDVHRLDGLAVGRFETLSALGWLVHGVSTRAGGVSAGRFASLNVGLHCGDDGEAVLENRRRLCRALGVEVASLVACSQVLGNAVAWVTEADRGRGATDSGTALAETDSLITDSPGVTLTAFSADCPLIALVDPQRRAVGLAHASRKGTLGRVAERTARAMGRLLGCDPSAMLAGIAPSIGGCCYEVGGEVLADVRAALPDAERFIERRDGSLYLDLWAANVAQLVEAGVPREQIEVGGVCSKCHADEYFSYRASGGQTGRFALLVGLRDG